MLKRMVVMGVMGMMVVMPAVAQEIGREDLKENRLQLREASEGRKERLEELRGKLKQMRDTRKERQVERFITDMANILKKRVAQLKVLLRNIDRAVARLEAAIAEAKSKGKDTTGVEADLAGAKVLVADARTAIEALAGKDFTPVVTGEATLASDLKTTRNAFASEVENVRAKLKVAHAAVVKVLTNVKKLK